MDFYRFPIWHLRLDQNAHVHLCPPLPILTLSQHVGIFRCYFRDQVLTVWPKQGDGSLLQINGVYIVIIPPVQMGYPLNMTDHAWCSLVYLANHNPDPKSYTASCAALALMGRICTVDKLFSIHHRLIVQVWGWHYNNATSKQWKYSGAGFNKGMGKPLPPPTASFFLSVLFCFVLLFLICCYIL